MDNITLLYLLMHESEIIANAISIGAQWEVWMQVEFAIIVRKTGLGVARELPYPPPNQSQKVDCAIRDGEKIIAIELKVESATNAGQAAGLPIETAIENDIAKIRHFTTASDKWVIGIAYSEPVKNRFRDYAICPGNNSIYGENNGVGFLIKTVI